MRRLPDARAHASAAAYRRGRGVSAHRAPRYARGTDVEILQRQRSVACVPLVRRPQGRWIELRIRIRDDRRDRVPDTSPHSTARRSTAQTPPVRTALLQRTTQVSTTYRAAHKGTSERCEQSAQRGLAGNRLSRLDGCVAQSALASFRNAGPWLWPVP